MPRAPTSLSLSPGTLSQCSPWSVCESDMTREMGSEFEFPKTWVSQLMSLWKHSANTTYRHGNNKVGRPLVELA